MEGTLFRQSARRWLGVALAFAAAASVVLSAGTAQAAKSGSCKAFVAKLGASTYSRDITLSNRTVKGKSLFVDGTFVEFTVNLDTFEVTNYTLTGAPSDLDITGGVRTVVFASKTPNHGQTLTGALDLDFGNEQIVLDRGDGFNMKIQAKDCPQGGTFQMEPEPGTTYTHVLGAGFEYYTDELGRTLFTNGTVIGRESPELANLISRTFTTSQWSVADGGRMGGVLGEDATEV